MGYQLAHGCPGTHQWLVARSYLSHESLALVHDPEPQPAIEEAAQLTRPEQPRHDPQLHHGM
jgi:hypothetical protein